jgi:hypothetical protein
MKDQYGADELIKKAIESGIKPTEFLEGVMLI